MRLPFGYEISFAEAPTGRAVVVARRKEAMRAPLTPVSSRWYRIFDTYIGQWQQDVSVDTVTVLTFGAVFACVRLIATDIGKLRVKLMQEDDNGICHEIDSPAFSPVLRKPNPHQTRIKFFEQWVQCKMTVGATFVLKTRDKRGQVVEMRVLDPNLVQPLVSESGAVFYRLMPDLLTQELLNFQEVVLPGSEIIHDVHLMAQNPLLGVSPLSACGLAAEQGIKIQKNSSKFFANQSRAGIVLSAPGAISDETAARLKEQWEKNFGGDNYGRTAVLGDGLEPKAFTVTAEDAQLIEQLGWTGEDVCRCFGVPAYKIGIGPMPAYNNIESLNQAYYSQTLQELIECIELLLDEGLELPSGYETEFDLDGLLRMDSLTRAQVDKEEISAGILAPNEARAKRDLDPVEGGDVPYLQQQNFSLAALAKRDAKDDPFATAPKPGGGAPFGQPPQQQQAQPQDQSPPQDRAAQRAARIAHHRALTAHREATGSYGHG